ncbi:MAG: hypothetical protein JRG84_20085, partial [Deltaproteobacteria bacterium]|nr:hypothetical protein [Deltaproteobacteria bacterium]
LQFDGFDITISGDLSTNLADYKVVADAGQVADGFRLVGPIGIGQGGAGTLSMAYDVWGEMSRQISSATLFGNGVVIGNGSIAIDEELPALGLDMQLSFGEGDPAQEVSIRFAPVDHLGVSLFIELGADVGGTLAALSVVDQRFETVGVIPEPGASLLFVVGLATIGFAQGRRAQH